VKRKLNVKDYYLTESAILSWLLTMLLKRSFIVSLSRQTNSVIRICWIVHLLASALLSKSKMRKELSKKLKLLNYNNT